MADSTKILIVEDNQDLAFGLRTNLEVQGYTVILAEDGPTGLELALVQRDGAVASRIELMSEVWGHASAVISRTVDTHVAELRRKLGPDAARPRHIITVRKSGYRLDTLVTTQVLSRS